MHPLIGRTRVAPSGRDVIVLHETGLSRHLDPRADPVAIAFHPDALDQDPMVVVEGRIVKKFRAAVNDGDDNVHFAIVVEVAEGGAAVRGRNLQVRAGARAKILKFAGLEVAEHGVRLPIVLPRVDFRIFADVRIGAEEIFVPIVVKIEDPRAPAAHLKTGKADTGRVGLLAEETLALVAEEGKGFASEGGEENAGPARVGPVPEIDTHTRNRNAVARVRHFGFNADLLEAPTPQIFEKKVPFVVVGDEDVRPAVAVIVRDRGAHAFSNLFEEAHGSGNIRKRPVSVVVV